MYETHFGLRHRPFQASPDEDCYYPATTHENAIARLVQAVTDDEGLALLTGEPGTGKTLVCRQVLRRLGPDIASAFLTNTHFGDRVSLLQAVLYDLGVAYAGLGEQELRLRLTDHLLKTYREGQRTLLVVDEAHHLSADLLEEIRLWGNLEGRGRQALQTLFAAQPMILASMRLPELGALRQRLTVRVLLEPLTADEAADYVIHRLRWAGGTPERVLSEEALHILTRASRGIPRVLSHVCHEALRTACAGASPSVDVEAALEAIASLGLHVEDPGSRADELADVVASTAVPATGSLRRLSA